MSRRIALLALAASAALTATPAFSDRECFEDSCRVLEATVPPPPAAPQASAIPEFVPPETADQLDGAGDPAAKSEPAKDARAEAASADGVKPQPAVPAPAAPASDASASAAASTKTGSSSGLAPASVLPKVIADPAPRQVPPQMSTRTEEARVRREPVRAVPVETARTPKPAPVQAVPARAPETVAPPVRIVRAPQTVPPPAQNAPIAPSGVAIIEVPGAIDTGDGVVTVYPNVRPDPAWKVCQIDQRDLGRRAYRCTAASYHPYGENGYRPYGDYRQYRTTPGYVVAPGAKIIAVDPGN